MPDLGTTLSGNGDRTYTLLDLLGDGLTARVFRAQATNPDEIVAVKALRPGLEVSIVERFHSEHLMVLNVRGKLEAVAAERSGASSPHDLNDGPATPPKSYEFCAATEEQPAFVAMEYMSGRKVEWLLAERGKFPELLGLRLGLQLFGLLHVLHTHLECTYDDFKFENLWWEEDAERLRVTDWNVLGKKEDLASKVPWDLERGARALLRVLTGAPLRPELRLDQQPGWDKLSVGAQALLRRMLDLEKQRRPQSAEEVCKELSLLIGYWRIEPGRGLRNAEAALDGIAEGQEAADLDEAARRRIEPTVRQVLAALSILHLRYPQEVEGASAAWPKELVQRLDALQERAEQYAPSADRLVSAARTMLDGHSFPTAAAKLRDAVQLFPDHLPAHRWLELAEAMAAGRALAVGENSRWQNAIKRCDTGDFEGASGVLANLPVQFAVGLRGEVAVHLAVKQAQGDSAQIEKKLQQVAQARTALATMRDNQQSAYATALQEALGTELETWEESLKKQAEAEQRRAQATAEASAFARLSTISSLEKGVERAEERLHLFLDEPEVVKAVLQLGEKCLEAEQYHLAARAFFTGAVLVTTEITDHAFAGVLTEPTRTVEPTRHVSYGPLLDHDHALAFRLRWLVAHAAYLRSVNDPHSDGEVERAKNAIKEARRGGVEAAATLDALWKHLAPPGQPLDTALFADTLKKALQKDETGVIAVIGEQLDASKLASALDGKLKTLDLSKLDRKTKKTLDGIVQTHSGLSPSVLDILTAYNSAHGKALSQTQDLAQAKVAIAWALEFPYHQSVALVKILLEAVQDPQKKMGLARQWRDMAHQCGAEMLEREKPVPVPPPRPVPTSDPVPAPKPLPAPLDQNAELLRLLNSNDPRDWLKVLDTPGEKRVNWSDAVRILYGKRLEEIKNHRRKMEDMARALEQDPVAVDRDFQAWQTSQQWVSCWDARVGNWVEVAALGLKIGRAAATAEAKKWLQAAQEMQKQGKSPSEVKDAAVRGMAYTKADPDVMRHLKELSRNPAGATQSTPGLRSLPDAARAAADITKLSSPHPPDSLQALLERPIRESATLTDLRQRIQGLLQTNQKHEGVLTRQYGSLQIWEEEDRWLKGVETMQFRPESAKSHAAEALRNLEALTNMEHWHPYIPTDRQTVFATTKTRLQAIAGQQRAVARHKQPLD